MRLIASQYKTFGQNGSEKKANYNQLVWCSGTWRKVWNTCCPCWKLEVVKGNMISFSHRCTCKLFIFLHLRKLDFFHRHEGFMLNINLGLFKFWISNDSHVFLSVWRMKRHWQKKLQKLQIYPWTKNQHYLELINLQPREGKSQDLTLTQFQK